MYDISAILLLTFSNMWNILFIERVNLDIDQGGYIMEIFVIGTLVYLTTIAVMLYNGLNA